MFVDLDMTVCVVKPYLVFSVYCQDGANFKITNIPLSKYEHREHGWYTKTVKEQLQPLHFQLSLCLIETERFIERFMETGSVKYYQRNGRPSIGLSEEKLLDILDATQHNLQQVYSKIEPKGKD